MSLALRILHLEDSRDDAELIAILLEAEEICCEIVRVQTRDELVAALERGGFDLIFSDFSLPGFDGISALELARTMRPEIPFLFVSGTLGEEVAINALKGGATDYVLKQRLSRLCPAVRRAVAEAAERRALQRAEEAMVQSEFKYRQLFECLSEAALLIDVRNDRVVDTNRQAEILLGRGRSEILGSNLRQIHSPSALEDLHRRFAEAGVQSARVVFESEVHSQGGRSIPVAISAAPILLYGLRLMLGLYRDLTERKQADREIQNLRSELARLHQPPVLADGLPKNGSTP